MQFNFYTSVIMAIKFYTLLFTQHPDIHEINIFEMCGHKIA